MISRIFVGKSDGRRRQIDTLKIFNANVTEIQEDVEYSVQFRAGGNDMVLLVCLPPEFPMEKPILKVKPTIIHPWVNDQSEVTGAPGLLNFTVHSDLGRVVQAIIREFVKCPPPLSLEVNASTNTGLQQRGEVTERPNSPINYALQFSPSVRLHSEVFPELSNMTIEELQKLAENDDRMDELIDSLPETKKMMIALDELMTKNEEIAKANLSRQPQLDLMNESVQKKLEIVSHLKLRYETLSQEYQRISERYSPYNIRECLRQAAHQSDEESEKVADHFLNREIDVEHFINKYIEKRSLSQCRKTKEEKLTQQLQELQRAGY